MNTGRTLATVALIVTLAAVGLGPNAANAGSSIKDDEKVLFFPTAAHRQAGRWVVPVHGWIFEPETGSIWRSALVHSLRSALRVRDDQEGFFRKRLRWFLVDNERGKKIRIRIGGSEYTLPKSKADGHFRGTIELSDAVHRRRNGSIQVRAKAKRNDQRVFAGEVFLVEETGLSVISDIDDTIKVTGAYDRKLTLERTFLQSFASVPGMAQAYRAWQTQGAAFHYVSASPWHLFKPLERFMRRTAYPRGSMHLRNFRLKDSSRWNLLKSSRDYKEKVIENLLARFPKRRFVLVGDTGERDPEVYSAIARRHPKQIEKIFLRLVRSNDMANDRRQRTNEGHSVPVVVFTRASELATHQP